MNPELKRDPFRRAGVVAVLAASLVLPWSAGALESGCVDCHTNLELLKKLAPSLPPPKEKLSHGEG